MCGSNEVGSSFDGISANDSARYKVIDCTVTRQSVGGLATTETVDSRAANRRPARPLRGKQTEAPSRSAIAMHKDELSSLVPSDEHGRV